MEKRLGRPLKYGDENLSVLVQARVTESDKAALEKAAGIAGQKLSDWMRDRLTAAAKREIRRAGQDD